MRCRSSMSRRLKTKPVSSMTSQFSGTSLASTHARAHGVEQGEGQSFKVGRQHEQRCVGEDFFQSISRKRIEEFNLITFVLAKVCPYFSVWLEPPASTSFIGVCAFSKASIRRSQFFSGENRPSL